MLEFTSVSETVSGLNKKKDTLLEKSKQKLDDPGATALGPKPNLTQILLLRSHSHSPERHHTCFLFTSCNFHVFKELSPFCHLWGFAVPFQLQFWVLFPDYLPCFEYFPFSVFLISFLCSASSWFNHNSFCRFQLLIKINVVLKSSNHQNLGQYLGSTEFRHTQDFYAHWYEYNQKRVYFNETQIFWTLLHSLCVCVLINTCRDIMQRTTRKVSMTFCWHLCNFYYFWVNLSPLNEK